MIVTLCVCERERERERKKERNSLPRKEVAKTDSLNLVWYPFLAHFTNLNHNFLSAKTTISKIAVSPSSLFCLGHIPYLSFI